MQLEHLYSAEEVAKLLTLKPKTVIRKAQMAEWPHVRLPGYGGGNRYVFTDAQLQQIISMLTVNVAPVKATAKASARPRKRTAKAS